MSQTTIRVDTSNRDQLARVAAEHDETLDDALARLLWEHHCRRSSDNLSDVQLADYEAEQVLLGNGATEVVE